MGVPWGDRGQSPIGDSATTCDELWIFLYFEEIEVIGSQLIDHVVEREDTECEDTPLTKPRSFNDIHQ